MAGCMTSGASALPAWASSLRLRRPFRISPISLRSSRMAPDCPEVLSKALDKTSGQSGAIRLDRREIGEIRKGRRRRRDEAQAGSAEAPEVIHPAIVHGEDRGERQVIDVAAEFHVVSANAKREVIGEL